MNYIIKSICVALLSTIILSNAFGQHRIELRINPATGLLADPGTEIVLPGEYVLWSIKPGENISWFRIEGANPPCNNLPASGGYSRERGDVRPREPRRDWKYRIIYVLTTSPERKQLDPKIAIRPTRDINNSILMFFLGAIVPLLTSILFYRKWKAAKSELEKLSTPKS
ncbi:MAG: hypothetical protein ABI594_02645 [Ginsengibacter sp.]